MRRERKKERMRETPNRDYDRIYMYPRNLVSTYCVL